MFIARKRKSRARSVAAALMTFAALAFGNAQAAINFQTDFESPTALTEDNWAAFINVFSPDCSSQYWYGYPYAVTNSGPQVAALAPGATSQVANIYSDYDNANQGDGCVEANVYQQFEITESDVGDYDFSYDVELPPDPANVGTAVNGFIKVFNSDFSATLDSVVQSSSPGSKTLTITITPDMVGGFVQFGFNNYSTDYDPTGMYYDNVSIGPAARRPGSDLSYEGVPTLGTYGLLALLLLMGATAAVALVRRS